MKGLVPRLGNDGSGFYQDPEVAKGRSDWDGELRLQDELLQAEGAIAASEATTRTLRARQAGLPATQVVPFQLLANRSAVMTY